MTLKLLTEHHLEFLSFKGGCTGSSESTLAKNILLEIACHGSVYIQLYRQCANDKASLRICTGPQEHLLFTHWHSVRTAKKAYIFGTYRTTRKSRFKRPC